MWISIIFYRLFVGLYHGLIALASPFHNKARLFTQGRSTQKIKIFQEKTLWFHCASLGEFEQARPLIEWCHKELDYPIIITFFSPSGYEYKVDFPLAKAVYYLPMDTPRHATAFVDAINPKAAFFIKYEFWYFHLSELQKQGIPHFLVAGIFRESQIFFRSFGLLHRSMLKGFTHCFVQDQSSLQLLHQHQYLNSSLAYDTRFDSVHKRSETVFSDEIIEEFIGENQVLVVGSSWPKDEAILSEVTKQYKDLKVIIAPHDVNQARINQVLKSFPDANLYSGGLGQKSSQTLIIDRIGILSLLYRFGTFCYIGGGFNASVHNVLEAAVYGKALIFGPNHQKSKEAKDLLELNAAQTITNEKEALQAVQKVMDAQYAEQAGKIAAKYVEDHLGGTKVITNYLLEQAFI